MSVAYKEGYQNFTNVTKKNIYINHIKYSYKYANNVQDLILYTKYTLTTSY